ncbi:MAG: hypothetical protein JF595_12205 [Sphingomonadales bacterium]|nr:hypothetical protein [Sphingomonadales bacterium]
MSKVRLTWISARKPRYRRRLSYMAGACHEPRMTKPSKILHFREFERCGHKVTLAPLYSVNVINFVSTKGPRAAAA